MAYPVGPDLPTAGADDAAVGTETWTSPGNVTAADGSMAGVTLSGLSVSHYLVASAFPADVPAGATVVGIEYRVLRHPTGFPTINLVDNSVRAVKAGVVGGDEKALGTDWGAASDYAVTYGGPADLWGLTWTVAEINDAGSGVAVSAKGTSAQGSVQAAIRSITRTVYYTITGMPGRVSRLLTGVG